MNGLDREDVLSPDWDTLVRLRAVRPLHPEIDSIALGSSRERQPPEIEGSGYVVQSLEAALRAVNLGDDADTTGAVCGQLAGAHWGESAIPPEWRDGLAKRELINSAL